MLRCNNNFTSQLGVCYNKRLLRRNMMRRGGLEPPAGPRQGESEMPDHSHIRRLTVRDIARAKGDEPIVCLTAYTAPVARIVDEACDLILVGDSLGMVLYGMDSTVGVTVETMISHGRAVVRATGRACIVVDLPFGFLRTVAGPGLRHRRTYHGGDRLRRGPSSKAGRRWRRRSAS